MSNRDSFHQLSSLYFCEECDSIRCSLCVTVEPSSYFCPNCLFDTPLPSVKESRGRCDRSCFECPICQTALNLVGSDNEKGIDPLHANASVGVPPYYLLCNVCKWDSKESSITFEKPTGLALQMKRAEVVPPDFAEFDGLKTHFKDYMEHQLALLEDESSSNAIPASSKSSAAMAAASAALSQSRLLKDVPSLARDQRFLKGLQGPSTKEKDAAQYHKERNKTYKTNNGYVAGVTGVAGKRDERRIRLSERLSDGSAFTTFDQRWQNLWDQNVRVVELKPTPVRLQAKQTKRCPSCRHIIIKPDIKAPVKRFKIRLMAMNYLPDIFILGPVSVAPLLGGNVGLSVEEIRAAKRASLLGGAGSVAGRSSESGTGSSLRRRPQSVMVGAGGAGLGGSAFLSGSAGTSMDEEHLTPGRIYTFEVTFTNPLDDAMQVNLGIILPSSATAPVERAAPESPPLRSAQGSTSPPMPSSPPGTQSSPRKSAPAGSNQDPTSPNRAMPHNKQIWSVTPSTTFFPINAFNEVWELDEEDADLLKEPRPSLLGDDVEDDPGRDDFLDEDGIRQKGAGRKTRKSDGILKRKGNATTIGLDLSLGKEAAGDIEFLLYVAYTYRPDEVLEEEGEKRHKGYASKAEHADPSHSAAKTFSFWCRVRLGHCDGASTTTGTGLPSTSAAGASRAAALDRRRSVLSLGPTTLNVGSRNVSGPGSKAEGKDAPSVTSSSLTSPPILGRNASALETPKEDAAEDA
ncbi:Dynactin, subunit p62 [Ceraceosorus bombacis]|uniref:Dynactin subunit 4 n=1 Tax=Ceraceosorus bombacis TaxID=401625 RepID=A0A0P1B9P6_9BASI|nr:Dynactin, subunit p62 [Ceraceosorus bombacis]